MWCCSVLCGSEDMDICCIRAAHRSKFFTTPIYAKWWKMKSSPYRRTANTAEEKNVLFFFFLLTTDEVTVRSSNNSFATFHKCQRKARPSGPEEEEQKKKKTLFDFSVRFFYLWHFEASRVGWFSIHTHKYTEKESYAFAPSENVWPIQARLTVWLHGYDWMKRA